MPDFRLICGDSLDTLFTLGTDGIDHIVTDPPYASGGRQQSGARNTITKSRREDESWFGGDNMGTDTYIWFLRELGKQFIRVTRSGGHLYVFTDWRQYSNVVTAFESVGYTLKSLIVWDKNLSGAMGSFWRNNHEFIVCLTKGKALPLAHRSAYNTYRCSKPQGGLHPTEKPVELLRYICGAIPPGIILDPFAGSGSTGVAAAQTGHSFIGIDHNQEYIDLATKRLNAAYSQPTLLTSGEPHESN